MKRKTGEEKKAHDAVNSPHLWPHPRARATTILRFFKSKLAAAKRKEEGNQKKDHGSTKMKKEDCGQQV
jgi:hypothetical protein